MNTLKVDLGTRSYDIHIGENILPKTGGFLAEIFNSSRVAVVSDDNVFPLYGKTVIDSLQEKGFSPFSIVLPNGEQTKSVQSLSFLWDKFLEGNLKRNEPIIALGGGVIGDLAGFAASTYMRGVSFVQIPTTLLAQVDSSVGGKTAVNIPGGKNLAGSFYQPKIVIADTNTLKTLTPRDFSSGMAEVIKYAIIRSPELFDVLNDEFDLADIIKTCCSIKADVVRQDEFEGGLRKILNYGHTFAHAIEKLGDFKKYTHGEAVAIGMVIASREACFSCKACYPTCIVRRITALCKKFNLPVDCEFSSADIAREMKSDKKNESDEITVVIAPEIGKTEIKKFPASHILEILEKR